MDLVRTVLLYMMMLVGTATGASPEVTPIPVNALPTPTPYVTAAPTAVPTAQASTPRPTRYTTLYVGDKGNAVRALQNRLKELGYLTGNVDGSYGTQTKTAVENFQRANGLKVDGIAGRNTQQVMFESENVVYASKATLVPTVPPATPTPVAPALVTVRYVDAGTGVMLHQSTVQCYGDTYVYADNSNVSASYRLVSNNYVSVRVANGQASPATVTFYYQRSATAAPVSGLDVPVYYLDSSNLIVARETRKLYQSGAVAADLSRIPSGYSLSGSSVVYVTISNGTASPNPIIFRLNRNQVTPAPTATPQIGVVIPVNYVNAVTGRTFASQNITMYASGTVYPQANLVPSGYTLLSDSFVSVSISNGRAYPSSVTFRYQPYQPTATPIVGITIPIRYVDASNSRTVYTDYATLTGSGLVYANMGLVPGYTLASASSVYVTIRNGQASPASVTFRVNRAATPTPAVIQVAVPVRYLYNSQTVGSQTVYLQSGSASYVYADDTAYPVNYMISGSNREWVTVSAAGVASPAVVTFHVTLRATPTPTAVPVYEVTVPVRYQYGSTVVASTTVSLLTGRTTKVTADPSLYSDRYDLAGDSSVSVTVSSKGVAKPSVVVFYVVPRVTPTPIPEPAAEVPVTVNYLLGDTVIATYQQYCPFSSTTAIYADPNIYEGRYIVEGDGFVEVEVDSRGVAFPPFVNFYLSEIGPSPVTPEPSFDVTVDVEYRNGNQVVYSTYVILKAGKKSSVKADPSIYSALYNLDSGDRVTVTVDSDSYANPNPVIFFISPKTPVTAPPTISPFTAPPSGRTSQELPSYQQAALSANYAVYQGPGYEYYRSNNGKATYGKGGSARIYGTDGEWLLIGYELGSGDYRIGYITDYTLPDKVVGKVQPLTYAQIETTIAVESVVTDDPVINMKELEKLQPGTPVTFLAWASSKHRWALIEYQSSRYGMVRAFVKGANLACMKK